MSIAAAQEAGQTPPPAAGGVDAGAQTGTTGSAHSVTPNTAPSAQNLRSAGTGPEVGEVVVTARRRQESLSKVPISVSVLSSQSLAKQSIHSEQDLQAAVPGLVIKQGGSNNVFNYDIRGQTVDSYSNSPPAVLPYINEAQITTYSASSFYDLQSIQVLKGPQGTLFGRNTTGGAVLYQTGMPGDTFSGYMHGLYGDFGSGQVDGAVTLPINDKVALRLAGNYTTGGAYVHNLFTNTEVGDNQDKSGRATLIVKPVEHLKNTSVFQYTKDDGTNVPGELSSANACGATSNGAPLFSSYACFYNPANPTFQALLKANPKLFAGGLAAYPAYQASLGPYNASINSSLTHHAIDYFLINTTEYQLAPNLEVKNIFTYNQASKRDFEDFDGTPYGIFEVAPNGAGDIFTAHQVSDELQLQGKLLNSRLIYTVGFFYLDEHDTNLNLVNVLDLAPIAPPVAQANYAFAVRDVSLAGFGQATYSLTDKLHLTGGVRYSQDQQHAHDYADSVFGAAQQQRTDSDPSWNVSVDYQLTPHLLLYATTRGSWRTGGFNATAAPLNATAAGGGDEFLPETTEDVEVGTKFDGRIGGRPVTATFDAYNQWVHNVQRANFTVIDGAPGLVTANVPEAEVDGLEGSLNGRPLDWLDLGVSGAFTDARFTSPNTIAFGQPVRYGPYGDAPKWTGSIYAEADKSLPQDEGSLSLRADAYGTTGFYYSNLEETVEPNTRIRGYGLLNLRLSWVNVMKTNVTAAVFAKNVLDKEYFVGGLATSNVFGVNSVSPAQPRFVGGELRYTF